MVVKEMWVFYRTILFIIFTIKFRNRKSDNIYTPETSALQILIIIIIIIIKNDTSKSKL